MADLSNANELDQLTSQILAQQQLSDLSASAFNNSDVSDTITSADSTLTTPDDTGGTSISDAIEASIGALPGLILLARTPANKLPSVAAVQNPRTGNTSIVSANKPTSVNWSIIIAILAVAAIVIAIISHKGE